MRSWRRVGLPFTAAVVVAGSVAWGRHAARAAEPKPAGVEAVQAEIAELTPKRLAWKEIAWKNCPLQALKEARESKRPVLAWVFLGNPTDERC